MNGKPKDDDNDDVVNKLASETFQQRRDHLMVMIFLLVHLRLLLEVKLSYDPAVRLSVGWSVSHNFCLNFLIGPRVSLPCSQSIFIIWQKL